MDAFIPGLEPELHAGVRSQHPKTLEECMKEAQLVNDRNVALKLALSEWRHMGLGERKPKSISRYNPLHKKVVRVLKRTLGRSLSLYREIIRSENHC